MIFFDFFFLQTAIHFDLFLLFFSFMHEWTGDTSVSILIYQIVFYKLILHFNGNKNILFNNDLMMDQVI